MAELWVRRVANWFDLRAYWKKLILVAAAGAFTALGQAPFDVPVVLLIGFLVGFLIFRQCRTGRDAFVTGMAFGSGYFAVSMMWIVAPFFVDAGRHGWMAPFALVFMAVGLSLFWGLAFGVARWLGPKSSGVLPVVMLAVTLTAAEMLRAYVFTGFPWGMPSQAMINGALGQTAAWVGPHGVNFILFLSIALIAGVSNNILRFGVSTLLIVGVLWPLSQAPKYPSEGRVIRLVQPNAPQHEKWAPTKMPVFYQRQLALSSADPIGDFGRPDLVVWPETALPVLLQYAEPNFIEIAKKSDAPVVLGLQRLEGRRLFNSLVVLDRAGGVVDQYDKHHLVPFGEYLPFGEVLAGFGFHGLAASQGGGFSAGPGPGLVDLGAFGRALVLICYEAVFPQDVFNAPERPDFLMQITNDAWFGEFAGPYQHLALARMRAIEQGLPMVRVANTGVSAMIDGRGRITHSISLGHSGFVDAPLPPMLGVTLYSQSKDWPILMLLIIILGARSFNRGLLRSLNRD